MYQSMTHEHSHSNYDTSFLQHELDEILATGEEQGAGWRRWKRAAERAKGYTDQQLLELFNQANTLPCFYDIQTRGESDVDLVEIPSGETWGDFLRRVAARVLQYELATADLKRKHLASAIEARDDH